MAIGTSKVETGEHDADLEQIWVHLLEHSSELDWLDQDGLQALGYAGSTTALRALRAALIAYGRQQVIELLAATGDATADRQAHSELARATHVLRFLLRSH